MKTTNRRRSEIAAGQTVTVIHSTYSSVPVGTIARVCQVLQDLAGKTANLYELEGHPEVYFWARELSRVGHPDPWTASEGTPDFQVWLKPS